LPYHFGRHKSFAFVNACLRMAGAKAVLLQTPALRLIQKRCFCKHQPAYVSMPKGRGFTAIVGKTVKKAVELICIFFYFCRFDLKPEFIIYFFYDRFRAFSYFAVGKSSPQFAVYKNLAFSSFLNILDNFSFLIY